MSSKYYYLVAGLPELSLEDSKLSYTVADFKTEIYPGLSASDQKLIDLFYLKFDNANVLKLLKDKEAEIDKRGNYSAAELTEYISMCSQGGSHSRQGIFYNDAVFRLFSHCLGRQPCSRKRK